MFTVTDNEDHTLSEKNTLEEAILYAWAATNHNRPIDDEKMAYYIRHFERYKIIMMAYGFYIVSIQAKNS